MFRAFPDKKLEEIIKIYPNKMIVTLGVEGSIYYDGAVVQKIPAIKAEVVDTTGAGDTFNGAFAYAISKGKEMNVALSLQRLLHIFCSKIWSARRHAEFERNKGAFRI